MHTSTKINEQLGFYAKGIYIFQNNIVYISNKQEDESVKDCLFLNTFYIIN